MSSRKLPRCVNCHKPRDRWGRLCVACHSAAAERDQAKQLQINRGRSDLVIVNGSVFADHQSNEQRIAAHEHAVRFLLTGRW
jgi:predicted amidophosphoribosyltransferase